MEVVALAIQEEDEKMIKLVVNGVINPHYDLVDMIGRDQNRAARIHREAFQRKTGRSLGGLRFDGFDYNSVKRSCEMPVGYVQIPVGFAGPLLLEGKEYMVPLAIIEGRVVSLTDRGCKAIYESGGASSALLRDDGITSTLVVRFVSALRAAELKFYLENPLNFDRLVVVFTPELYRPFIRLRSIKCMMAGKNLYVRFNCFTGDSMGSGVANLGAKNVLEYLRKNYFPDMDIIGSSGIFSSEKTLAAVNWIEGSGKSVVCEAIIKEDVVTNVLRTSVSALAQLNSLKNLDGALGRSNAHATNVVAAIFLATGQDPAQIPESSTCITMMEPMNDGKDLHVSVTMPSIGVVTVGDSGTGLASQSACLNLLGVTGVRREMKDILIGSEAKLLAAIVAGSVLAAELSLMSANAEGQFDEQSQQGHI